MTVVDALVIGGGPAGASAAVWLARAGWRVVLAEQHAYPRQKVCGECLPAGAFSLLDELGVGDAVRRHAGPELKRVGWMDAQSISLAGMPPCATPRERYGRAVGRDVLDALLMERARTEGVDVRQPARVTGVSGRPGEFHCEITAQEGRRRRSGGARAAHAETVIAAVVIDAHGSWERAPRFPILRDAADPADQPAKASDLFAFKATFTGSALAAGLLPVFALAGGYGGMVVANDHRTTVALCLRRDVLHEVRRRRRGVCAGEAVQQHLLESCRGAREALRDAQRQGAWLAVGPLRPGLRVAQTPGVFRVGNAAAEAHPLVGEGMRMALQSSRALVRTLTERSAGPPLRISRGPKFRPRLHFAACCAHIAMRPQLAAPVGRVLQHWPGLLTAAAMLAGKARPASDRLLAPKDFA